MYGSVCTEPYTGSSPPRLGAGGAPLDQLAVIGALYWGGTAALVWLVLAHRRGSTRILARAAGAASWVFRSPAWVALPVFIAAVSLLATMAGGFWDIGYHIDYGRDNGPLGNPGHWPQLFGFFGTFAAGILCLGLAPRGGRRDPGGCGSKRGCTRRSAASSCSSAPGSACSRSRSTKPGTGSSART